MPPWTPVVSRWRPSRRPMRSCGPVATSCSPIRGRRTMADASAAGEGGAAELVFDDVTKRYPGRPQPAVNSLSLVVPAGDICVLVGPSGAGKTTAMKMVNRLIDITDGDITIEGRS